jgi:hypothetical protein
MHGSSEQNVSIGYFWTDFMRQKWEKMSLKVVLEVIKWKKKEKYHTVRTIPNSKKKDRRKRLNRYPNNTNIRLVLFPDMILVDQWKKMAELA